MNKVHETAARVWFQCPGCKCAHAIAKGVWGWNGSLENPTFTPSVLTGHPNEKGEQFAVNRCHSFVTDGKIQFLGDCWHELKDQTIALPDWHSFSQQEDNL